MPNMYLEKVVYANLYQSHEAGTMKWQQRLRKRFGIKPTQADFFECNNAFVELAFSGYVIEAIVDYFGIDEVNGRLTKNIPPSEKLAREQWMYKTLSHFVDTYVLSGWLKSADEEEEESKSSFSVYYKYFPPLFVGFFLYQITSL